MKKLCKGCTNIDQFVKKHGYNPVRDERSEESADWKKELNQINPQILKDAEKIVDNQTEEVVQAERTRIIKALEGLKVENPTWDNSCDVCFGSDLQCKLRVYSEYKEGFNAALDQAIKAVGESAEKGI